MSKTRIYLLGLITLLLFPAVGLVLWYYIVGENPLYLLTWSTFFKPASVFGLAFGALYAVFGLFLFRSELFKTELFKQRALVSSLKLNHVDRVFLSFCAGFGEEILFRVCIQSFLGIWLTSILFVAIHGYLNPKNKALFLYGLCLIPFIVALGYAYGSLGLWFCIMAHFAYDLVLFFNLRKASNPEPFQFTDPEDTPSELNTPE